MKLRIARHTNDLNRIIDFYTQVLMLEVKGSFENHNHYDGIFLGSSDNAWELEFTKSDDHAQHSFDEDDLLVFYLDKDQLETLKSNLNNYEVALLTPKNPYWMHRGVYFKDPDGYGIILALNSKEIIV